MNQMLKNALFVGAMFFPGTVGVGSSVAATAGCTQQEAKTVTRDFLTLSELACITASALTDAPAVATACKIDSKLVPALEPLLAQKAAAKRAGACSTAQDAGAAKDSGQ